MIPNFPKITNYSFLDPQFNPENQNHIKKFIDDLKMNIPKDFRSAHRWFSLFNEGSIAITDCHVRLELETYLDIDNENAEKKLKVFDEKILSQLLTARYELMDIYINSPWRTSMHANDDNKITTDFLLRKRYSGPEITELQIRENSLIREYRKIMNKSTVVYHGKQIPISALVAQMNDNDRDIRKESFLFYWEHIKTNEESLQNIFSKLLKNRLEQTNILNLDSYASLAFNELGRFDYGAKECSEFCEAIKETVVPILQELSHLQKKNLGVDSIKPWDIVAWPSLSPKKKPAGGSLEKILDGMEKITANIDEAFGQFFTLMRSSGLLNVYPETHKAPGAFCVTFQESAMPYIFGNLSGNFKDAMTLAHEFGHALHGHASAFIPNILLRNPGMEFSELAAIGFELLTLDELEPWWAEASERAKAQAFYFFGFLNFWPFMAMIDQWQHAIYSNNIFISPEDRNKCWQSLSRKFRPQIDWDGIEQYEGLGWFSRPHIFTSPFYYIDYGLAQLGAIQLWNTKKDKKEMAIKNYIKGISMGAQKNLKQLFAFTGLELDFSTQLLGKHALELKKLIENSLE